MIKNTIQFKYRNDN